ncbi:hypothetical protein GJ744_011139 [Endocarpon pusillum]|uniref:MJ1316 RNA cyclic group end recognition domain-containing protein n=1 Tax=Endocarpon pusillum TaxID=364733 RepID=A0A8H7AD31_9EURO|nr:hypothetical protein GJ744_011139 [Endocarpon pusillum]
MQHHKEAVKAPGEGDESQTMKTELAETDTAAEYFERYERRRGNEESTKDSNMDYWLSEDEEEESHQLRAQKRKSRAKKEPCVVQDAKAPKLRPAEDVLKRLRWDPSLDSANFTIGYLERFAGIMEMPLATWVTETSDEDFIPQHRIKYFKRNTDGEIVWDREARIDKIFGSGLTGRVDDSGRGEGHVSATHQQGMISAKDSSA